MAIIYNKLVRDKVPANIASDGQRAVLTVVRGEELLQAMRRKVVEEANELSQAETREQAIEEIGDLLEIIAAYRKEMGIRPDEVQAAMMRKTSRSGNFTQGYFLLSVSEDSIVDLAKRR